ncbi:MAG: hypothetical protein KR126chlam2_00675 [Chlamydiae bacterium]|nr:hypothetical protein [Chlamydiota bacterium]
MNMMLEQKAIFRKTRSIFILSRLFNTPFWTIYNMLFIILYKELHATPFQITSIIVLKPMTSLISPYWSSWIEKRQDRLVSNIVWANILKYIPFLFFPWFQNVWWCIFSFGFYMFLLRGANPAWMEIIKLNIQGKSRERVFAIGSTIDYLGSAVLPIAFAWVLDDHSGSWTWVFFFAACIGILSTLPLIYIPLNAEATSDNKPLFGVKNTIIRPWKSSWTLIKERPDFRRFQVGFMLGGAALMMMHTILPVYFVDVLELTYKEIMFAIALCKGIGFALSSPFWVNLFHKINIFLFCSIVTVFAGLFPVFLFCGYFHISAPYIAYIIYGIMQAGSELSWNMSGPYFAKDLDSSTYSSLNVLTVGLRGCVAPVAATLIGSLTNATTVMVIAFILCAIATERMRSYGQKYSRGLAQQNLSRS